MILLRSGTIWSNRTSRVTVEGKRGLDLEVAFLCSHSIGQNPVTWLQMNCRERWEIESPGGSSGLMSTQPVRGGLGLDLRCFPPSPLAFFLVQVLLVGFLLLASVVQLFFFFPLKTEQRVEEINISGVHQPLLLPAAFTRWRPRCSV